MQSVQHTPHSCRRQVALREASKSDSWLVSVDGQIRVSTTAEAVRLPTQRAAVNAIYVTAGNNTTYDVRQSWLVSALVVYGQIRVRMPRAFARLDVAAEGWWGCSVGAGWAPNQEGVHDSAYVYGRYPMGCRRVRTAISAMVMRG